MSFVIVQIRPPDPKTGERVVSQTKSATNYVTIGVLDVTTLLHPRFLRCLLKNRLLRLVIPAF